MFRMTRKALIITLLFLFAAGACVVWGMVHATDQRLRREMLQQARIAARAIFAGDLSSLSASERDLETAPYRRIKSQLASMREARPQCRFLYLMGRHASGDVYFFVDSLPVDSDDYAPPGLIYDEVSDPYLAVFETGREAVVGPVTDRWGTLITSLIPIKEPDSGRLLAVLGMDVDAQDWRQSILSHCVEPFMVTLLLAFLVLLLAARERTLRLLRKANAEVKTLTGLLPICCNCKKIRDDGGYWRQIEVYMQAHSNAEFSHGICPECAKKLYPDL